MIKGRREGVCFHTFFCIYFLKNSHCLNILKKKIQLHATLLRIMLLQLLVFERTFLYCPLEVLPRCFLETRWGHPKAESHCKWVTSQSCYVVKIQDYDFSVLWFETWGTGAPFHACFFILHDLEKHSNSSFSNPLFCCLNNK